MTRQKLRKSERIKDAALGFCLGILFRSVYVAGLALLIPALLVAVLPASLSGLAVTDALTLFGSAGVLVSVSVAGLLVHTGSWRGALMQLGRASLVPGVLALVFAIVHENVVFALAARVVPNWEVLEPIIRHYVESTVPHVLALAVSFVVLGLALMFWGSRLPAPRPARR